MMWKSSFQLIFLFFLTAKITSNPICAFARNPGTAGFGVVNVRERTMNKNYEEVEAEFVTKFYTQTLDHFNYKPESYTTFQQKYIVNFKYWGGAKTSSPIFVYTGDEQPITNVVLSVGFMLDLASRFNGLLLYIEVGILRSFFTKLFLIFIMKLKLSN